MSEKLSINSELFKDMRAQFDTILNSIVKLLEAGDEGKIALKVQIDKKYLMDESDEDGEPIEKRQLDVKWDITRTIKAKKYKLEGRNLEDYFLEEDEDGTLRINKVEQMSLFDGQGNKVVEMKR